MDRTKQRGNMVNATADTVISLPGKLPDSKLRFSVAPAALSSNCCFSVRSGTSCYSLSERWASCFRRLCITISRPLRKIKQCIRFFRNNIAGKIFFNPAVQQILPLRL